MRYAQEIAIAVAVLISTFSACSRRAANDTEQAAAAGKSETEAGADESCPLSPKELLVGRWKRTIAIDKAKLEPWLQRGGYEKLPPSREELLAKLEKIVTAEETVEYHIDGTMFQSKWPKEEITWKVLEEGDYRVRIEVRAASMKGPDKVVAVNEYEIVFRTDDRIVVDDSHFRNMPLTQPVWHRLSRGSLNYTGPDAAKGPPPFRRLAVPLAKQLEACGVSVDLDEQGNIIEISGDTFHRKVARPD